MDESPIQPPSSVSPQYAMQTPKPSRTFLFLLTGLVILFGGIFGGFFLAKSSLIDESPFKPTGVACTMEAKLCLDGSSVGRSGPKCEFSPCPQITTTSPSTISDPTANWKTYSNTQYRFMFKYPTNFVVSENKAAPTGDLNKTVFTGLTVNKEIDIGNPERWMYITASGIEGNFSYFELFSKLKNLKIGESTSIQVGGTSFYEKYTRLSDVNVGDIVSYVFETPQGWETPPIWRVVVVPNKERNFYFGITYSNPSDSQENYPHLFDQILSTFKFLDQKNLTETICGGWDTSGEVVCGCTGSISKSVCPANAVCDSGSYYCNGMCGSCCYKGVAENTKYPRCQ